MDTSSTPSHESLCAVRPAKPTSKQNSHKIFYGFLGCGLAGSLSTSTLDMPRKRGMKEQKKVYQQCRDDQEKHEQKEQKKIPERLRKGFKDILKIRTRLRRHRYAVKPGSPPLKQPPCCPHGDEERSKTTRKGKQNKKKNDSNEGLGVYESGQMSRGERYRARLWGPTSKEAGQKAVCEEARCSSTATNYTSSVASDEVDAEMERLLQRVQAIEWRNKALIASLGVKPSRVRREHPEEPWEEGNRVRHSSIEGVSSGGKSLGTAALKGTG
ncbi:hypothetical protein KVR01_005597 [Diaporthe batatas]|uniref:uncharacterized protein n=1 Tax=Diaporthe batatas TaxID=748121 RepID=UPI001D0585A1|nr:uncharacterized protein KVR01_005597 [Diaporthe batatas]KAG8165322.1 hypothetical protein KVR01_005597 [Diaporthe batatas]